MLKSTYSIEEIKINLISACINYNPKSFIPYLLSSNVKTSMPNKMRFYWYFKYIVKCAQEESVGELYLRKEQPKWRSSEEVVQYNFYDQFHKYSRISIEVIERESTILMEVMPF